MFGHRFDSRRGFAWLAWVAICCSLGPGPARAQETDEPIRKAYIASFGLSAAQKVFRYEAAQAARVLTTYYGRGGETVVLPNRQRPRIPGPATVSRALLDIASRMDKERDVLIVFMTSHGTERGLAITQGRRNVLLTPGQLGAFLHQTGVRNKVVIISACHSGVFIPLANSRTLVITASDAANVSFGCDDTRNMTYFGDSLINKGVPATETLPGAFGAARSTVAGLELRDCSRTTLTPAQYRKAIAAGACHPASNPQMAGGEDFANELRALPVDAATKRQLRLDVF
jgi:Peptidase C13 family